MPKIIKTRIAKGKKSNKKYSTKTLYVLSALKGFIVSFAGLLITSYLLYKNGDFSFFYKMIIYLSIAMGGFLSGYIAHNKVRGRGFLDGIISASVYSLMLIFIFALLLKLNVTAHILIIVPICLLSGFIGGIVKA